MSIILFFSFGFISSEAFVGLLGADAGFLFEVAIKNALLLFLAAVICSLLARRAASLRHAIWATTLTAVLLMPVFVKFVPSWGILPTWNGTANADLAERETPISIDYEFVPKVLPAVPASNGLAPNQPVLEDTGYLPTEQVGSDRETSLTTGCLVLVGWVAGVVVCLLPLLASAFCLLRLQRSAGRNVGQRIHFEVQQVCRSLNCVMPLVVIGRAEQMPMVWKFTRSFLLLPAGVEHWNSERLKTVLLHELAHLRRGDPTTLLIGQCARALNWFNPLAWYAVRKLRTEQEFACDDFVLKSGVKPEQYATDLLELSTRLRTFVGLDQVALSMASPSKVESRLKQILNPLLNRKPLNVKTCVALIAVIALTTAAFSSLAWAKKTESTDVDGEASISWPYCELNIDDLSDRSIKEALVKFNRDAKVSPIGSLQKPITADEILKGVESTIRENSVPPEIKAELEYIVATKRFSPQVHLRRFTRFDDGKQMHGVWWVRLVVEATGNIRKAITVRSQHLFARPYTLLERKQTADGALTVLNRLASYHEKLPKTLDRPAFSAPEEANQFAKTVEEELRTKRLKRLKKRFNANKVSLDVKAFFKSEIDEIANGNVHQVSCIPRKLDGYPISCQAFHRYQPNLPVDGFLQVEYTPVNAKEVKRIQFEIGRNNAGKYLFVGYVVEKRMPMPKTIEPSMSVTGQNFVGVEVQPEPTNGTIKQPMYSTWTIANPGKLLSAHLANEEIWLRDIAKMGIHKVSDKAEPWIRVTGKLFDKQNGEAILRPVTVQAGKFDPAIPSEIQWGFSESRSERSEGKYSANVQPANGWTMRVIVDGYRPHPINLSEIKKGTQSVKQNLKLTRGRPISGRVLDYNGQPIASAAVLAVGPTGLNVFAGRAYRHSEPDPHAMPVEIDSTGSFRNVYVGDEGRIAITSEKFHAWPCTVPPDKDFVEIKLPAPSSLLIQTDRNAEAMDSMLQLLNHVMGDEWAKLRLERYTLKINQGETKLVGLPPGPYQLFANVPVRFTKIGRTVPVNRQFFQLEPGKQHMVDWRRPEFGSSIKFKLDWNRDVAVDGIMYTVESLTEMTDNEGQSWTQNVAAGQVDKDSPEIVTWKIRPGKYKLIVQIQKPIPDERLQFTGIIPLDYTKTLAVEVTKDSPAQIDLGTLSLDDFK